MKTLLSVLVMLLIAGAPALAGPNQNGVIVVHDTGIEGTVPLPPASTTPTCAEIVNEVAMGSAPYEASDPTVWKVYAAFPLESSPRLKGCGWGVAQPNAGGGSIIIWLNGAPSEAVFFITSTGWPGDNSSIGMSFTDSVRTDPVDELFWFVGYAYAGAAGEPQSFCIIPHEGESNRFFLDDAVPQNADPIAAYGCLGFGQPGSTPCPDALVTGACCHADESCTMITESVCLGTGGAFLGGDCTPTLCVVTPTGACCFADGTCQVSTSGACAAAGGVYMGDATVCTPNPCLAPLIGACCFGDFSCSVVSETECSALDGTFLGGGTLCDPNPCLPIPIETRSWGRIKNRFR